MDRTAWLNGSFVPLAEAKVSAQDRGFHVRLGRDQYFATTGPPQLKR